MVLKANYAPDERLASITVMEKRPSHDDDYHDWFSVKYRADGALHAAGKPAGCISCRGTVRSKDYVFSAEQPYWRWLGLREPPAAKGGDREIDNQVIFREEERNKGRRSDRVRSTGTDVDLSLVMKR